MNRSLALAALLALLSGCSSEATPDRASSSADGVEDDADEVIASDVYEREIVFTSAPGDSTLITPWLFRSRTGPAGVEREAHGLLSRGGTWESFFQERWMGPESRSPWRILPRRPLRVVVGENDSLERLIFQEGTRELELSFGETLTEWAGPRGEIFRLQEGTVLLSNQQLDGLLLDIGRARRGGDPPAGDWAFLVSENDFQLFLDDPGGGDAEAASYRAWTRSGSREVQWPAVDVEWTEVRAFDRARRDVPYAWHFESRDQELRGDLTVGTAHLAVGEGAGPVLPVLAFYEVSGRVHVAGTNYDVRGIFRHTQH